MKPMMLINCVAALGAALASGADVTITVDADAGRRAISPWIYGKNNSLSDDPQESLSSYEWGIYRDAGLRMLRENGGNNATKYNWRQKLTSHPDWYNNVYDHDWDFLARSLQDNLPGAQGFLALQLLGKVAANKEHNFNDWDYNASAWWDGCAQNLAGGGTLNPDGGDSALTEGNSGLYLTDWPADSTAAILDHWFGSGGLGLDCRRFAYWNMDNEPEIWCSTHDDALPLNITAEEFMQKYFAVAKSARQRFPDIKLAGFVACNEWQWYAWDNSTIPVTDNGAARNVTWAEYFIKRVAEEQKTSGVRLLDVMDFHFYPGAYDDSLTTQLHRIWFDTSWIYPKANGCKLLGGGWDENIRKEYIMERCRRWLDNYMGEGHGVGLGVSECGSIASGNPNVIAVWYASHLGTFADEGVELFTPWEWNNSQWEVLHLFSRYCGTIRVASASSLDSLVSAYSSISAGGDSMTVILVNRDQSNSHGAAVTLTGFSCNAASCATLQLKSLPADKETFKSHEENALVKGSAALDGNIFLIELPALSVTAAVITGQAKVVAGANRSAGSKRVTALVRGGRLVIAGTAPPDKLSVSLYTLRGACVRRWAGIDPAAAMFPLDGLPSGRYVVEVNNGTVDVPIAVVR